MATHVRNARKKSKAPLIVGLILAVIVLAAVVALIWIDANCIFIGGKLYRQGDFMGRAYRQPPL